MSVQGQRGRDKAATPLSRLSFIKWLPMPEYAYMQVRRKVHHPDHGYRSIPMRAAPMALPTA